MRTGSFLILRLYRIRRVLRSFPLIMYLLISLSLFFCSDKVVLIYRSSAGNTVIGIRSRQRMNQINRMTCRTTDTIINKVQSLLLFKVIPVRRLSFSGYRENLVTAFKMNADRFILLQNYREASYNQKTPQVLKEQLYEGQ